MCPKKKRSLCRRRPWWPLFVLLLLPASGRAAVVLVDGGETRALIMIGAAAPADEQLAADELAGHLALTGAPAPEILAVEPTGAAAAVARARAAGRVPVLIGTLALDPLRRPLAAAGAGDDSFMLAVADGTVRVAGPTPAGTLNGVYELLEQLGFRWFLPGELGRVLPAPGDLALAVQSTVQVPSFAGRTLGGACAEWSRRNRVGGRVPPGNLRMPAPGDFDTEPELYALVGGERNRRQLCLSNPRTLEGIVARAREHFRAGPDRHWLAVGSHGGSHCECAACRAMDPPGHYGPYTDGINVSDRYLNFFNRVLEALEDEFPRRRISLTVASWHLHPPVRESGHPRLDIIAWPASYCRYHGVDNPVCPERNMLLKRTRRWVAALGGDYYERRDWGNLACPGFLFPLVQRHRTDIPAYQAAGVTGFRSANYSQWLSENPSAYIGVKLLWDHEADVDALLADFYRRYYGPASAPMRDYHELVEAAVRDSDHHTGSSLDMPHVYTAPVRRLARGHLGRAARLAGRRGVAGIYARRVAAVIESLDYLESFLEMIAARDRHDYATAVAALERTHAFIERFRNEYDHPMLTRNASPYLDRFFGNIVREAYQRTVTGGELAAALEDRWDFQLDPQRIGEELGWWEPGVRGGNWGTINAWSTSWSNQGLRYYRGDAWYRQAVFIPGRFAGRRLKIWVGAVDERATVWVNGRRLGDSPVGAFRSFEFDATAAVRPGAENLVVIRAGNHISQEVGTGGLLAPVFFHAPAENDEAP